MTQQVIPVSMLDSSQYYKSSLAVMLHEAQKKIAAMEEAAKPPADGEQMIKASAIKAVAQRLKDEEGFCEVIDGALVELGIEPSQELDVVLTVEVYARVKVNNMEKAEELQDYVQDSVGVDGQRNGDSGLNVDISTDSDVKILDAGDVYLEKVVVKRVSS